MADHDAARGEPSPMLGIAKMMMKGAPHARALGFVVSKLEPGRAFGGVAYRPDLVGDPETGVIAGGVLTALLDQLSGVAVMSMLEKPTTIATIDLRIDYMRAAAPGRDVQATAHCYKLTRSVAFVRALAYEDDPDDPIAQSTGAFMLASDGGRAAGANASPPR